MRVMVILKTTPQIERDNPLPDAKLMEEMGKYNEELIKAGIVLAMDGLRPSSKGAIVKFSGKTRTVIDGPFTEAKELIAGFWIWQVKTLEEAIEWVKRVPGCETDGTETEIEVREIGEMEDFESILSEEEIEHKKAKRAELPNQTVSQ
ncbi:MAG: YciI family protein [Acidobacteriaceae bacterium]